ncbi:hypothetical protein GUJ93_ZPchr0003g16641 [Zizania palustris]|uniref:Uncharacterized protein n=1 Tax=Zizania palustris TaxID=103762 RepID=A0A8J5S6C3_ZIZPA|nr:hypothetical protein GUJ93_ZPchr0003g16641 [Zizania palustris]
MLEIAVIAVERILMAPSKDERSRCCRRSLAPAEGSSKDGEEDGWAGAGEASRPALLDVLWEVTEQSPSSEESTSLVTLLRPFIPPGVHASELLSHFFRGIKGHATSNLVAEMGHYSHADLAAAIEEAILQTVKRASWWRVLKTFAVRLWKLPDGNNKPKWLRRHRGPKKPSPARLRPQRLWRLRDFGKTSRLRRMRPMRLRS